MPSLDEILNANKPSRTSDTPMFPATRPPKSASQIHKERAGPFPRPLVRRFLIVISLYDGDHERAIELANLIYDLQKTRNTEADILFYHRNDARAMEPAMVEKMRLRFLRVYTLRCTRLNARGHPYGCNEMWYALIELMRSKTWASEYYAFYNMEPDCTPLVPDWIARISKEFRVQNAEGFQAVGQIKDLPVRHLNGAAVYSTEFYERAGGLNLVGGKTTVGYDVHHAERILKVAADTPMMGGRWGIQTISEAELWSYNRGGECVIFHGGKDSSVIDAVRKKHLTLA